MGYLEQRRRRRQRTYVLTRRWADRLPTVQECDKRPQSLPDDTSALSTLHKESTVCNQLIVFWVFRFVCEMRGHV